MGSDMAGHGIFAQRSSYVETYLLEVFLDSFFEELLSITYVLHCTDCTCCLVNYDHFPTLIIVDRFSLNFVLFRAIAFPIHKVL